MKNIEEIKNEVANLLIHASDWYGKISGWSQWERNVMPTKTQYDIAYHEVIEKYANQFKQDKPLLGLAKTSELIYELSARCDTGSIDKGGDYRTFDY